MYICINVYMYICINMCIYMEGDRGRDRCMNTPIVYCNEAPQVEQILQYTFIDEGRDNIKECPHGALRKDVLKCALTNLESAVDRASALYLSVSLSLSRYIYIYTCIHIHIYLYI